MAPLARDAREQHEQCLACATAKCYESCTASHPGVAVVGEHLELRVVDDCPTVCGDVAQS